jgi:hypothetical protein
MGSFLLTIDEIALKNIKLVVKYAEEHPVDFKSLMEMKDYGKPGYTGLTPAGINPNNTIKLHDSKYKYYYNTALSIEEMDKVWVRHFSASVNTGESPNPHTMAEILPLFGFNTNNLKQLMVEVRRPAIHILEPLYMSWKEFFGK